jgi:hypothetical protein
MGYPFNTIGGFIGGFIPYIIAVSITCSYKWALVIGIIGFAVGAFGLGFFTDSGGY